MKNAKAIRNKRKVQFSPLSIFLLAVLIIYGISFFALLYWGLISSFKDGPADFKNGNMGFGFPRQFYFNYYSYVFNEYHIDVNLHGQSHQVFIEELFHNSFVYAIGCSFFQTLVPCLTAYVCARYKFKFLNIYYYIVIITMIIPIVGSTASEIKLATTLHLYNELWGLWIMKANFLGMYFLVFHSTFKGLPEAYSEAARIDGAGNFSILFKIMLPLVKTTFLTIFLINFVQYWNDYSIPFLYLNSRPTVFIPVYYASSGGYTPQELAFVPGKAALAFIALIPTVLIFVLFHKKLLGNITVGGIK